jgi:acetate---CoA ligase (ADP-forming)
MLDPRKVCAMEKFFYPSSVAVIGVADIPVNLGKNIIENLIKLNFTGSFYAVGRETGNVAGNPIYKSVSEIPYEIDLAMILVPARDVPGVAEECGKKGIRRLVISSAGFSESGPEKETLDRNLRQICDHYNIRVVGPNCMGLVNMDNGLCLPFTPEVPGLWQKGPLGIISQSGTVAMEYARRASVEKVGVSKVASIGNKFDLDEVDYLEYYLKDTDTQIIFLYLEGFSRGRELFDLARFSEKPILLHKSNTSELSRTIARSHTNALADDDEVTESALRQAGMIRVKSLEETFNCIKVLLLPELAGNRMAVLSTGGGIGVQAADACHENGFELPSLPNDIKELLKARGRAGIISPTNPIDLGDIYDPNTYPTLFDKLIQADTIDGIYFDPGCVPMPSLIDYFIEVFRYLNEVNARSSKPVFVRVPLFDYPGVSRLIEHMKIPLFQSLPGAFEAMRKVMEAKKNKQNPAPVVQAELECRERVDTILHDAVEQGRGFVDVEGFGILEACGIPVAKHMYISKNEMQCIGELNLRFPVVLKAAGDQLLHKTEAGGVRLGIQDQKELSEALADMAARPALASARGFMIQEMIEAGVEMIVGGKRDPQFGPLVMVGMGGVMVELFSDISIRLAPVDTNMARSMLETLKCYPLLKGYRGAPPADLDSLFNIIKQVSDLMVNFPAISEIDLNPVKVLNQGEGAVAVDCRVILKK